jgi:hypothetical protein
MADIETSSDAALISHYIINLITDEKVIFKTLPEDVSETYAASWETTDIRGRSAPYIGYAGNEARSVSYSITLQDDICDNMMKVVKFLKGLVYPKYSGSIVIPPYCLVHFGGMVSNMTAVVNNVSLSWGGPILSDANHYSKVDISLDFTELRRSSIPTAKSF